MNFLILAKSVQLASGTLLVHVSTNSTWEGLSHYIQYHFSKFIILIFLQSFYMQNARVSDNFFVFVLWFLFLCLQRICWFEKLEYFCLLLWSHLLSQQDKMAQWVKVLATKPDNLSLIPRTHTVGRVSRLSELLDLHMYTGMHTHTHTHRKKTIRNCKNYKNKSSFFSH